ncbi:polysaccharide deacetylase family protein [Bacillus sp. HNG]|uniref:polysaccharide deacetylase family protein n=1 Tax=Bacillus sp. HNG TaxID=2293325 RepID=UPI000E2FD053|nr:polysaccharide deacetylase family protein [Bacillus sp. HNG]RFB15337.1 polysaccharide deacetylase family protein [Bacillus sp. HNG]
MKMFQGLSISKKVVAFTFDDGPHPIYTPQILDIFKSVGGSATFFMVGEEMENHPELVKRVANEGHEIGNHTYSHPFLSKVNNEECLGEIERNEIVIEELVGQKPVLFRPPYFDYNDEVCRVLDKKGYSMIGAVNLDARDWEQPGVEHIFEASLKCVKKGSILIFHDGYGNRIQTVEAVRMLVQRMKDQGYHFVTVSELLKDFKE